VNTPFLSIPSTAGLVAGNSYIYNVRSSLATDSSVYAEFNFTVNVVSSDLIATIEGGSFRQVSASASFFLDATGSSDPDQGNIHIKYTYIYSHFVILLLI